MTAQVRKHREKPKAVRTTISLNPLIHEWGAQLSEQHGFRSMSDYFEFLIRLHKGAPALK